MAYFTCVEPYFFILRISHTCEEFVRIYLRNKFHFSEVHESMNATGPGAKFGRHVNFARDPLRSYFHEPQKN